MEFFDGGVTSPRGFVAAGIHAGIKREKKDMAMLVSEKVCTAAGVFTSNLVKAAPVIWDKNIIEKYGMARACVMNSGCANACTGEEGEAFCRETAQEASLSLSRIERLKEFGDSARPAISPEDVLLASTGVIGLPLPMDKIRSGVDTLSRMLSNSREASSDAVEGIMTTDTARKESAVSFMLGGKRVILAGMTKGAGMIHPQMGTMLCFITTDAAISHVMAQRALLSCVEDSFNMISVDGDQSTNDTCILMANGLAGNIEITEENLSVCPADYETFKSALGKVTKDLARKMAADGEGAHALFEVKVRGASSKQQAVTLAKSVIGSSLVKTSIAGHDANWGRIICAMGYSGAIFDPRKTDITYLSAVGEIKVVGDGISTGYNEDLATKILSENEITVVIDIKEGEEEAVAWGCDLTHEYIDINADYRS